MHAPRARRGARSALPGTRRCRVHQSAISDPGRRRNSSPRLSGSLSSRHGRRQFNVMLRTPAVYRRATDAG
eukprot:10268969-Alexandrium_andersonii.AAC.1